MLIIRDAHMGLTRFNEFRTRLGIAPSMLSKRLVTLVQEGLFEKISDLAHPPREEYLLTLARQDVLPILFVLAAWSRTHNPCANPSQISVFIGAEAGNEIEPVVIDKNTGIEIGKRAIRRKSV